MRLRPHHLLCTQGYSGKGYSQKFVDHMTEIVTRLRGEEPVEIQLVFENDDICTACPYNIGENICETQAKVKKFDQRVVDFFKLEPKTYIYQELIQEIDQKMTGEMMDKICEECNWYPVSACKNNICNHK